MKTSTLQIMLMVCLIVFFAGLYLYLTQQPAEVPLANKSNWNQTNHTEVRQSCTETKFGIICLDSENNNG